MEELVAVGGEADGGGEQSQPAQDGQHVPARTPPFRGDDEQIVGAGGMAHGCVSRFFLASAGTSAKVAVRLRCRART
jgi:hypothetical protein